MTAPSCCLGFTSYSLSSLTISCPYSCTFSQLTEQEQAPFEQLLHALKCGAPPHGGIALGKAVFVVRSYFQKKACSLMILSQNNSSVFLILTARVLSLCLLLWSRNLIMTSTFFLCALFKLGFDRLMAILCRAQSIRDVIAFPKTSVGTDLLFKSPATISEEALYQYGLRSRTELKEWCMRLPSSGVTTNGVEIMEVGGSNVSGQ